MNLDEYLEECLPNMIIPSRVETSSEISVQELETTMTPEIEKPKPESSTPPPPRGSGLGLFVPPTRFRPPTMVSTKDDKTKFEAGDFGFGEIGKPTKPVLSLSEKILKEVLTISQQYRLSSFLEKLRKATPFVGESTNLPVGIPLPQFGTPFFTPTENFLTSLYPGMSQYPVTPQYLGTPQYPVMPQYFVTPQPIQTLYPANTLEQIPFVPEWQQNAYTQSPSDSFLFPETQEPFIEDSSAFLTPDQVGDLQQTSYKPLFWGFPSITIDNAADENTIQITSTIPPKLQMFPLRIISPIKQISFPRTIKIG